MIIDVDPQSHIAVASGYNSNNYDTITTPLTHISNMLRKDEIIDKESFENIIIHHELENVDLVLSDKNLSTLETNITDLMEKHILLKEYIEFYKNDYDYIIIDCLPTLTNLTINVLAACDYVLILVEAQQYAINVLNEMLKTIARTIRNFNPNIKIMGIVIIKVDMRTNYHKEITKGIRVGYSSKIPVFNTMIPLAITVQESVTDGRSIHSYDPKW